MRERDRKHRKSFSKFIVVPNVIGSARAIDPRRNKVKHEDHSKRKKKIMENIDGKKKEERRPTWDKEEYNEDVVEETN